MKRGLSVLLAMVLMFGLCMPVSTVYAAEEESAGDSEGGSVEITMTKEQAEEAGLIPKASYSADSEEDGEDDSVVITPEQAAETVIPENAASTTTTTTEATDEGTVKTDTTNTTWDSTTSNTTNSLTIICNEDGETATITYTGEDGSTKTVDGKVVTATDENGATTTTVTDENGNVVQTSISNEKIEIENGVTTTTTTKTTIKATGTTTTVTEKVDGKQEEKRVYEYDANGNLVKESYYVNGEQVTTTTEATTADTVTTIETTEVTESEYDGDVDIPIAYPSIGVTLPTSVELKNAKESSTGTAQATLTEADVEAVKAAVVSALELTEDEGYSLVSEFNADDSVITIIATKTETVTNEDGTTSEVNYKYSIDVTASSSSTVTVTLKNYRALDGDGETKLVPREVSSALLALMEAEEWYLQHIGPVHKVASAEGMEAESGDLLYVGNGIQSTVMIGYYDAEGFHRPDNVQLRQLVDSNGNVVYAYCAQRGTTDIENTDYEIVNVSDYLTSVYENYWGVSYEEMSDDKKEELESKIKTLNYIVARGFWGNESNAGSLQNIRKLLVNNTDYPQEFVNEWLDEGIALAVTQAAIWTITNPDLDFAGNSMNNENNIRSDEIFEYTWLWSEKYEQEHNKKIGHVGALDWQEREIAMALYNILITGSKKTTATDVINLEDIVSTNVEVVDKIGNVEDVKGLTEKVQEMYADADVYNTNLSLTLAVVRDNINSNDKDPLTIYVYAYNGKKAELVTQISLADADYVDNDNGTVTFTVKDVAIADGLIIRLQLAGTQNLNEGTYIYRSDADYSESQTFTGFLKGDSTREVNLRVALNFNVDEENASKVTVKETVTKVTTVNSTGTTNFEGSSSAEKLVWSSEDSKTYEVNPGDDPKEDDNGGGSDDDDDDSDPDTDVDDNTDISETEVPLADLPDMEVPLADIPDEDVPLATIPRTGDYSTLWTIIMLLSGLGLAGIMLTEKREKDEA